MKLFVIRNKKTGNLVTAYSDGEDESDNLKPRIYKTLGTARSSFSNMYWRRLRRHHKADDFEIVELSTTEGVVYEPFNSVTMNTIAGLGH